MVNQIPIARIQQDFLAVLQADCSIKILEIKTLADFIQAFQDQGVEVDLNEKPFFQMIGAKDGIIFYMENSPVKVYEFDSVKNLKKVQSEDDMIKDWPTNGRFLLETRKQEAIQIFENVK